MYIKTSQYHCKIEPNGVITGFQLANSDINLIPNHNGWGCEFGDWNNFFSQLKHLDKNTLVNNFNNNQLKFEFIIELSKGNQIKVSEEIMFEERSIIQEFDFEILSPIATIGDFVNRFVIRGDILYRTELGEKIFTHYSQNIYHQFIMNDVKLSNETTNISIENQAYMPKYYDKLLDKVVYIRDEPKLTNSQPAWIIHSRLITSPTNPHAYVLRWFYPNVKLPTILAKIFSLKPVKILFWRLREKWPYSPLSLGGTISIEEGEHFKLRSIIKINNK